MNERNYSNSGAASTSETRYLDAKIAGLELQINDLKLELKELRKDNKEILEFVHQAKGGKRYIMFIVTLAVSLGAILGQIPFVK